MKLGKEGLKIENSRVGFPSIFNGYALFFCGFLSAGTGPGRQAQ
jgi:hypothetical protein